jgi:hypothetical protein
MTTLKACGPVLQARAGWPNPFIRAALALWSGEDIDNSTSIPWRNSNALRRGRIQPHLSPPQDTSWKIPFSGP